MTAPSTPHQHASADDPRILLDDQIGAFESVPPYPPRTEREAEFYDARRRRDVPQHGPPAPVDPRRAARRAQDQRRAGGGPRPGPRVPPPRRGEAVREQRLPPHHQPGRPARVRQLAVQRVGAGHGVRAAARHRGAAPGGVHPGPHRRAQPDREPRPVHGLDGARPRRPHADPVLVHRARRDRRDAGGGDRPADAVQLLPDRRRQRRPEPRVHVPPRRLDEPRGRPAPGEHAAAQRERDLRPPDARDGPPRSRHGAPDGRHRPQHPRRGRALRHPAGAPVQRLQRARVQRPGPRRRPEGRRRARPLPAARGRGPREPPDHRPVPPQHAGRADHGQAPAPAARPARVAPGPRSRRRAGCTARTRSRTGRTSRSG